MRLTVLYTIGCPLCNVLKKKLDMNNIIYTEISSEDELKKLGIKQFPVLSVDGELLNFKNAVEWVRKQQGETNERPT